MYIKIKKFIFAHRVLSIIVLVLLVVLVSTLYYSWIQNVPVTGQVPVKQHIAANASLNTAANPTIPPVATTNYSQNLYTIAVPQTWSEDTNTPVAYQENMQSFTPDSNPSENAHVAIEINNTQDTSLASMSAGLRLLGFHPLTTSVDGIPAQKFIGAVTLSQKILHNTIYLFTYNKQNYLVKLSYQSTADDPGLEQKFTQMVNTMQLK